MARGMLQPDRLQHGIAPFKVKERPNVQFITASKFPETGGKSRQKAEKTGSLRKFSERVRKIRTFSNSGPKGRGEIRRRPPVEEISSADFSTETSELPGGQSRRLRLRREAESRHETSLLLSERYRILSTNSIVATPHCGACSLEFGPGLPPVLH